MTVTIALTVAGCPLRNSFQEQVAREVGAVDGVTSVKLEFDVMTPDERAALTSKLRGGRPESDKTIQLDPTTRVIAVASGKGGVGKSSVTVNLAAAFSALGRRVGVLDADIYGHSIPHMLGISQKPVLVDRLMIPPVAHDLKLMSIGFFVDDNKPLMWRGPMLHRALEQFLQDVHWGELDLLVVDMPPGTGDVSISLGQMLPRAEAVVVTTPQLLAQEVASRAAEMARRTGMQLLGVVENMTSEVFGSGGGERLATQLGVKLLGSVPLDARLREAGDEGTPLVVSAPDSEPAQAIFEIARAIDAEPRRRLHAHAAARLLISARRARSAPGRAYAPPMLERCTRAVLRHRVAVLVCWAAVLARRRRWRRRQLPSILTQLVHRPGHRFRPRREPARRAVRRAAGGDVRRRLPGPPPLRPRRSSGVCSVASQRPRARCRPGRRASCSAGAGILYGEIATRLDLKAAAKAHGGVRTAAARPRRAPRARHRAAGDPARPRPGAGLRPAPRRGASPCRPR